MPEGLKILLTVLFVSGFSLGISLAVMIIKEKVFAGKKEIPPPAEPIKEDPKILYITEAPPKKRKRRKPRKRPEPALKGIILRPEEFKKIQLEKNSD